MTGVLLPLVCQPSLHTLKESLDGDATLCRRFVGRYLDMLPARVSRIHATVTAGDWEGAMDAALSLFSSSMMVGAARLGELACRLVRLLKDHHLVCAAEQLGALRRCGNQTIAELTNCYMCSPA